MTALRAFAHRARVRRERYRFVRALIVRNSSQLRRGIYVHRAGTLAHRVGDQIPQHLRMTKLLERHATSDASWNSKVGWKISALGHLRLPLTLNLRGPRLGATTVVAASGTSDLVIDCVRGTVTRQLKGRGLDFDPREYQLMRATVQQYVRGPVFWFTNGDAPPQEVDPPSVVEQLVDGSPFVALSDEQQILALRRLLVGLVELIESASLADPERPVLERARARASELSQLMSGGATPGRDLTRPAKSWLSPVPVVPSHGDLNRRNLMHTEDGVVVIDWHPNMVGLRPFWFDPLLLISSASRNPSVRQFVASGGFDDEFRRLWAVAGITDMPVVVHREQILRAGDVVWSNRAGVGRSCSRPDARVDARLV